MSEIKSTLDIVMEKTKHLSMTNEEKLAKEKEGLSLAIKGLVQKYQDKILSMEMLQKELGSLHQRYIFDDNDILLDEILSKFDLESDNNLLFKLIKEVLHLDSIKLEEMLNQYGNEIKSQVGKRVESIKKDLKEKYSISGSAIVPNITTDFSLKQEVEGIKKQFHSDLNKLKDELICK